MEPRRFCFQAHVYPNTRLCRQTDLCSCAFGVGDFKHALMHSAKCKVRVRPKMSKCMLAFKALCQRRCYQAQDNGAMDFCYVSHPYNREPKCVGSCKGDMSTHRTQCILSFSKTCWHYPTNRLEGSMTDSLNRQTQCMRSCACKTMPIQKPPIPWGK